MYAPKEEEQPEASPGFRTCGALLLYHPCDRFEPPVGAAARTVPAAVHGRRDPTQRLALVTQIPASSVRFGERIRRRPPFIYPRGLLIRCLQRWLLHSGKPNTSIYQNHALRCSPVAYQEGRRDFGACLITDWMIMEPSVTVPKSELTSLMS